MAPSLESREIARTTTGSAQSLHASHYRPKQGISPKRNVRSPGSLIGWIDDYGVPVPTGGHDTVRDSANAGGLAADAEESGAAAQIADDPRVDKVHVALNGAQQGDRIGKSIVKRADEVLTSVSFGTEHLQCGRIDYRVEIENDRSALAIDPAEAVTGAAGGYRE